MESSPALPFLLAYLSPDLIALADAALAYPPEFTRTGDRVVMLLRGNDGLSPAGVVRAVHRLGALAVVELDHLSYEDDPARAAVVLVRPDAAPDLAHAGLAARLRAQYGERLTAADVAREAVVTPSAVYQAISLGRLASVKQGSRWVITPEQAAAWLIERGGYGVP
jgi:hypothetical protein